MLVINEAYEPNGTAKKINNLKYFGGSKLWIQDNQQAVSPESQKS